LFYTTTKIRKNRLCSAAKAILTNLLWGHILPDAAQLRDEQRQKSADQQVNAF